MNKARAYAKVLFVVVGTAYEMLLLWIHSLIKGQSQSINFYHRRRWSRRAVRACGIQIEEIRGEITEPCALVVSNHRTMLDPAVQTGYIDAHIIAKASVGNIPIVGKGAAMTGLVLVKRDKLRSRLAAREATKELLEAGKSVLVYAEGTTGTTQTSGPFKIGTFGIAAELGLPVIPVAIEYPEEKDYWYVGELDEQIIRQIGVGPTRVKLRIGDPIRGNDASELREQVQAWIDQNLLEMQHNWSEIFVNDEIKS
ncbi:MAG: lysophospholipid acyltransferase family protein [Bacteroidota bacterium]